MHARDITKVSRQFLVACFCKNMAVPRVFLEVSDNNLVKFSKENENENTVKKTEYDLRILSISDND